MKGKIIMKCLMAEVNFSEGRDQSKIDQIKEATAAPFEVAVDLKSMLD